MTAENDRQTLPAGLHFVATPIGHARDVTLRALDILRDADVLVAEDTRSLRRLMEIHGVPLSGRQVLSYHDHSGSGVREKLISLIQSGKSLAYASEAGTPLVSDPGFALGRDAASAGVNVTSAPGASAALAALTVSGLPSDCFVFVGFPPTTKSAREKFLKKFKDIPGTLILYESPKRLGLLLESASDVLGADRDAAICRELTKKFEEVRRGTLSELVESLSSMTQRGEIVVCIGKGSVTITDEQVAEELNQALETMKLKQAATEVAERLGVSKRDVYQLGLELKSGA